MHIVKWETFPKMLHRCYTDAAKVQRKCCSFRRYGRNIFLSPRKKSNCDYICKNIDYIFINIILVFTNIVTLLRISPTLSFFCRHYHFFCRHYHFFLSARQKEDNLLETSRIHLFFLLLPRKSFLEPRNVPQQPVSGQRRLQTAFSNKSLFTTLWPSSKEYS